jgi:hypothetical protein
MEEGRPLRYEDGRQNGKPTDEGRRKIASLRRGTTERIGLLLHRIQHCKYVLITVISLWKVSSSIYLQCKFKNFHGAIEGLAINF